MRFENAKIIKVHLESGKGYYVVEHKLTPFDMHELSMEEVEYVFENAKQLSHENDYDLRKRDADLFEYIIHNDMDYELHNSVSVYSKLFFTHEEFLEMCQSVKNNRHSEYTIAMNLEKMYPGVFITIETGAGCGLEEING